MGKLLPNIAKGGGDRSDTEPAGLAFVEGVSASMRPVEAVIRELAQSDVPVLVLAEVGAGKHATAQRIHQMSQRSSQPFRWFQCLGLEPEDLEVLRERENMEEQASAGTIYLQELADLSSECQGRLLEALPQSPGNGITGSERARLICGSARDLEVEVKRGRLREDLYYRISGVCLRVPPLRQRKDDIPFLMGYFLHYSWPGNLRELEDAARVLVALGDEHVALGGLRALLRKPEASGNGAGISLKAASRAASREAEKELILNTLTRTRWNRRRAAEELQISYKALLYKLKQIGFEGYGAS
jgi:DNA-binding NtrC family response regulator